MIQKNKAQKRKVYLGDSIIHLLGRKPKVGDRLDTNFAIAPARNYKKKLTPELLSRGVTIVSTLPNIHTNACHYQVLDLEKRAKKIIPEAKIFHISSDARIHWKEVDEVHPDLEAYAFSFQESSHLEKEKFSKTFGVGVEGNHRIAHGLFGLWNGIFCAVYIPTQQMGNPDIHYFFENFRRNIQIFENKLFSNGMI